jgi:arsenical pump membrane protein
VVSVLTLFTSNDIVVLTFTPFICYFAKHAKIDPLPYLICEFVAANTWSMGLVIGNPTNIYLAGSAGVGFAEYLGVMLLPTLLAGGASFLVLRVLFAARLRAGVTGTDEVEQIADKPTVVLGLASLGGCIALMVLSSYVNLAMWLIAAVCCAFLYVAATGELAARHRTLAPVGHSLLRAPFDVIPFVLSMFVLVQGLQETGVTELLATHLLGTGEIFKTGVASFLAANLVNNIPMSVLFSAVVAPGGVASLPALYAAVIGSNVGAFFTPMGALAGIMWMAMLRTQGVRLSFGKFMAYGAVVAIPTLLAALAGLAIVL